MKQSELINKIHHGEDGFLILPFEDCMTIAKVLLNRGYAIMITGGEMQDESRIDWVYAGNHDNLDYAKRDMVVFGSNDYLEMLEFGDYEKDEEEEDEEDNDDPKYGYWEYIYDTLTNDKVPYAFKCSECGELSTVGWKYCPNCGSKKIEDEAEK